MDSSGQKDGIWSVYHEVVAAMPADAIVSVRREETCGRLTRTGKAAHQHRQWVHVECVGLPMVTRSCVDVPATIAALRKEIEEAAAFAEFRQKRNRVGAVVAG